jgi:hypothetical protein
VSAPAPGRRLRSQAHKDHFEKGIVMTLYAQTALIAFAVLVLAIPLLGMRLIARLG